MKFFERRFLADYITDELPAVDWSYFREQGIRTVLLDWDNCLVEHGATAGGARSQAILAAVRAAGLEPVLFSNAVRKRAERLATSFACPPKVIAPAHKPSIRGIEALCADAKETRQSLMLVGDQYFTDIWCGKRAGILTLWTRPFCSREPFYIRLKRGLEWLIRTLNRFPQKYRTAPLRPQDGLQDLYK